MIKVTKIDDTHILVNEDWIEYIQESPDTIISFNSGKKMVVKESINSIIELINNSKIKITDKK